MPKFTAEEVREIAREARMDYKEPVPKMLEAFAKTLDKIKELDEEYEPTAYPRLIHELMQAAGLKE